MISPNISWAEKYRPKEINDLIFPDAKWKTVIDEWITKKQINGNIALFGPGGLGKSTLAKIIINKIINSPADLKIIKSRSVQEIDSIGEFIRSVPISSPIKIIIIEEADRLSSQAQTELKEKYTEQFQDHCSIIITSNFPYQIDEHLLQRFVYKIDFSELDESSVYDRLNFILTSEESQFNETDLKSWISNNIKMGMRNLINYLQLSNELHDGHIIFTNNELEQDLEIKIFSNCVNIITKYFNCNDIKEKRNVLLDPINSIIGSDWVELNQLVTNNYNINYEFIFTKLNEKLIYLPAKIILSKYIEELPGKKYQNLHLLSFICELLKCINEITY